VVIAGAPNVGKSSLVNALAGYQRSVVSAIPGTTRDVVTTRLAIDGWAIELADTAGLRSEVGSLEGQGIEQARGQLARADRVLWVLDASQRAGGFIPPVWPDAELSNCKIVVNKIDLASEGGQLPANALRVSALTGEGIGELCSELSRWLVPEVPPAGAAVPFSPELCDAVAEALERLDAGDLAGSERAIIKRMKDEG
jgi:tRNA modification GTPase